MVPTQGECWPSQPFNPSPPARAHGAREESKTSDASAPLPAPEAAPAGGNAEGGQEASPRSDVSTIDTTSQANPQAQTPKHGQKAAAPAAAEAATPAADPAADANSGSGPAGEPAASPAAEPAAAPQAAASNEEEQQTEEAVALLRQLEGATEEDAAKISVSGLPHLAAIPQSLLRKLSGEQLAELVARPGAGDAEALPKGEVLSELVDKLPEEVVQKLDVRELPGAADMPLSVFRKLSLAQLQAVMANTAERPDGPSPSEVAAARAEEEQCTVDAPAVCAQRCFQSDFVTSTMCDGLTRRASTVRMALEDAAAGGAVGVKTLWAFLGEGNVDEVVALDRSCKKLFFAGIRDRLQAKGQHPGAAVSALTATPQEVALAELYIGLANLAFGASAPAVLAADEHPAYSPCKFELEFLAKTGLGPVEESLKEVLGGTIRRRAVPPGHRRGSLDDLLAYRALRGLQTGAMRSAVGDHSMRSHVRDPKAVPTPAAKTQPAAAPEQTTEPKVE